MVLRSCDKTLKKKEVEIQAFYHKTVMLRDRLRVMEQKITAHKSVDRRRENRFITIHNRVPTEA
jgi:hypothetical protein